MSDLGQLESLAADNDQFAAEVAVAEFVRRTASMLKAMRLRAGLDQTRLGRAIGLSQGRISQIESGLMDHAPNLETVARYANACAERVAVQASGERSFEQRTKFDFDFSLHPMDFLLGAEGGIHPAVPAIEVVAERPAVRAVMVTHSGLTPIEGSTNRFRLSDPLSVNVMEALGLNQTTKR